MNKNIKTILLVLAVVAAFVFASLVTGKKAVEVITLDDYKQISSKKGFVYFGKIDEIDNLKEIAKDANIKISVLDSENNKNAELKEGTLYEYKKGKEVYSYTGDINSYKFTESLMNAGILEKTYVEVTFDEYKELYKSKGYNFMFIGSETCGWCSKFKEEIKQAKKEYNFNIYYIDLSSLTEEEYNDLLKTDSYLTENEWGTPLNLLYKDGKRVNVLSGYVQKDELIEYLKENKVIE